MVINLYKQLKLEKNEIKYIDLMQRISNALGIGLNKVRTIVSEYKQTKTVTSPNRKRNRPGVLDNIDDFDKNAIRRKVHSFWLNKELPTLAKVLNSINEDNTLPNMKVTSLRKVLKS